MTPPSVEREEMRFLSHDDVATLVDGRYRAMPLVAAYRSPFGRRVEAVRLVRSAPSRRTSMEGSFRHPPPTC
jgi:hypothetical protein